MDRIINLDLLMNPGNWLIVIAMLALFVFGLHLLQAPLQSLGGTVNVI